MKKKDELDKEQQIPLKNIINELKRCDTYSRASKFYDKSIKSKKIKNLMKAMGLIKYTEFSEINLYNNKINKKKDIIPFSIKKIHNFLLKEAQEEKQKEIIKKEKLNNTTIKKLHQLTELNINHYKYKHPHLPPCIGTYTPNYNSIYKKTKASIITDNRKDNIIKNKSGLNIMKTLSLNNLDDKKNNKKYSTLETIKIKKSKITERKEKDKNINIFSYKSKNKNQYPLLNKNKSKNLFLNTISDSPTSSNKKYKIKSRIKNNLINEFDKEKNNSISFNNSGTYYNQSNSSKKNSNLGSTYKKQNNKNLINRTNSNSNSKKIKSRNISLKTIFIKPSIPSIGYYHPKYDYIKENIPKISFLSHNNKKDNITYKKNLLRKIITNYNIYKEYQLIQDLNNKYIFN